MWNYLVRLLAGRNRQAEKEDELDGQMNFIVTYPGGIVLRSGPELDAERVGNLRRGESVIVLEERGRRALVQTKGGGIAWMSSTTPAGIPIVKRFVSASAETVSSLTSSQERPSAAQQRTCHNKSSEFAAKFEKKWHEKWRQVRVDADSVEAKPLAIRRGPPGVPLGKWRPSTDLALRPLPILRTSESGPVPKLSLPPPPPASSMPASKGSSSASAKPVTVSLGEDLLEFGTFETWPQAGQRNVPALAELLAGRCPPPSTERGLSGRARAFTHEVVGQAADVEGGIDEGEVSLTEGFGDPCCGARVTEAPPSRHALFNGDTSLALPEPSEKNTAPGTLDFGFLDRLTFEDYAKECDNNENDDSAQLAASSDSDGCDAANMEGEVFDDSPESRVFDDLQTVAGDAREGLPADEALPPRVSVGKHELVDDETQSPTPLARRIHKPVAVEDLITNFMDGCVDELPDLRTLADLQPACDEGMIRNKEVDLDAGLSDLGTGEPLLTSEGLEGDGEALTELGDVDDLMELDVSAAEDLTVSAHVQLAPDGDVHEIVSDLPSQLQEAVTDVNCRFGLEEDETVIIVDRCVDGVLESPRPEGESDLNATTGQSCELRSPHRDQPLDLLAPVAEEGLRSEFDCGAGCLDKAPATIAGDALNMNFDDFFGEPD